MYKFTWKVLETGNIDTYLLLKELEKEEHMVKILPLCGKVRRVSIILLPSIPNAVSHCERVLRMLHKFEGIVIRTTDYGESNKIVTIYT